MRCLLDCGVRCVEFLADVSLWPGQGEVLLRNPTVTKKSGPPVIGGAKKEELNEPRLGRPHRCILAFTATHTCFAFDGMVVTPALKNKGILFDIPKKTKKEFQSRFRFHSSKVASMREDVSSIEYLANFGGVH